MCTTARALADNGLAAKARIVLRALARPALLLE